MSSHALSQTLSALDSIPALVASFQATLETTATKARVALETMAVAMEEEEEGGEYKEPKDLTNLKLLDITPGKISSLLKLEYVFNELIKCKAIDSYVLDTVTDIELIQYILQLVDPSEDNNRLFYNTVEGIVENTRASNKVLLQQLLMDPRIDPSEPDNEAIKLAWIGNDQEMLDLLLAHPRIDPSAYSKYVIDKTCEDGHYIDRMMADPHVDLAVHNNYAIRRASRIGHTKLVERLLQARDASGRLRVDPTALDNEAIYVAHQNGHVAVVELLKAHGCVLPEAP